MWDVKPCQVCRNMFALPGFTRSSTKSPAIGEHRLEKAAATAEAGGLSIHGFQRESGPHIYFQEVMTRDHDRGLSD